MSVEAHAAFDESLLTFAELAAAVPTRRLRYLDEALRNAQHFLVDAGHAPRPGPPSTERRRRLSG